MTTPNPDLIQEKFVQRDENLNPEYRRLLDAYLDNPFFDLTKASISEFVEKKNPESKDTETPVVV